MNACGFFPQYYCTYCCYHYGNQGELHLHWLHSVKGQGTCWITFIHKNNWVVFETATVYKSNTFCLKNCNLVSLFISWLVKCNTAAFKHGAESVSNLSLFSHKEIFFWINISVNPSTPWSHCSVLLFFHSFSVTASAVAVRASHLAFFFNSSTWSHTANKTTEKLVLQAWEHFSSTFMDCLSNKLECMLILKLWSSRMAEERCCHITYRFKSLTFLILM